MPIGMAAGAASSREQAAAACVVWQLRQRGQQEGPEPQHSWHHTASSSLHAPLNSPPRTCRLFGPGSAALAAPPAAPLPV